MSLPILIILYVGIILCVLLYLVKISRASANLADINQEDALFVLSGESPLVFPSHKPFVFTQKIEKPTLIKTETKKPMEMIAFQRETANPEIERTGDALSAGGKREVKYSKAARVETINIADVTRELINIVLKISEAEKHRLLMEKFKDFKKRSTRDNPGAITKHAIELIMSMPIEDKCRLLGECMSRQGTSRRKFSRKDYAAPVYFAVKGILQSAFTKNISNGGVLIETLKSMGRKIVSGDIITMNFAHPRIKKEIKIQGKIIRVTATAIAVCFDKPL